LELEWSGGRLPGDWRRLGHDVVVGTRDVQQTLARTQPDAKGTPSYAHWQHDHPDVRLATFADAGAHGEVVVNATAGAVSLLSLQAVGAANLSGKVLVDLAVPLDYSHGRPPRLMYANTDSLGERIQSAFPGAHVVKTLNTMYFEVMVDPSRVPGHHNVFVAGNASAAKGVVKGLLRQFGWPDSASLTWAESRRRARRRCTYPSFSR
jgi:predicted dinucleotide-binding enzyme